MVSKETFPRRLRKPPPGHGRGSKIGDFRHHERASLFRTTPPDIWTSPHRKTRFARLPSLRSLRSRRHRPSRIEPPEATKLDAGRHPASPEVTLAHCVHSRDRDRAAPLSYPTAGVTGRFLWTDSPSASTTSSPTDCVSRPPRCSGLRYSSLARFVAARGTGRRSCSLRCAGCDFRAVVRFAHDDRSCTRRGWTMKSLNSR